MSSVLDLSSEMINVRRAAVSLLVGSLLLVSVGLQAGAVETDSAALAVAERGLALGLQAADEIQADLADGEVQGPDFASALAAFDAVIAKLEAKGVPGRGPERAREVHNALTAGELPSSIKNETNRIPGLAKAYGHLRSQHKGEGSGPPVTTP